MENTHPNSLGTTLGDRSVECYARKLGVIGETIDDRILQGMRHRLSNLLVEDGKEVFELFSVLGRDANIFFQDANAFPFIVRVDKADPHNPNSRLRIVAVLRGPISKEAR